jgi:type II restriction enzyme
MRLQCDLSLAAGYTSQTQIARVLSEGWFRQNGYCLSCEGNHLIQTKANSKASDFLCPGCTERYELKAFRSEPTKRLVDGAYDALLSQMHSGSVPTLMLMGRSDQWQIQALTAVHHSFLTPDVVEKRKPLSPQARRAGWIGCNIRLDLLGEDARIPIVKLGIPEDRKIVREHFQRFQRLKDVPVGLRGWATFTLKKVRDLGRTDFTLGDLYALEHTFMARYPNNRNIRAKIRQQLQVLRDLGFIEFHGAGAYCMLI